MPELHKCPRCGAGLPSDAPGGHCISCLLQLGIESGENPTIPPEPSTANLFTGKPGDRIGQYKLVQQIGEGGCGVVYLAEQEEPIRRRVALKVIKLGMDTQQVIARFEAERQALALMDHPNIAKVLDAGATDIGRPYFVMELVCGVKITDYCDQQKLSTRHRLELFVRVCQAVQHAHQKGIIHRDLKPSNILVTEQEGKAVPKIIDFGIAKATTAAPLTEKTLFTAFDQFIGTPAYMSPEQAGLGGLDIDKRTDIYSLGVLLYELLTGKQPFDPGELRRPAIDEILRTIREKEPLPPSARLTTLTEQELSLVAQRHQSEPGKFSKLLRGDLDWIVMKALEKDRIRRYETANGLARDLERFANNEPVIARPPSNFYRLQKWVRRNKLAFSAVSVIISILILGLGTSTRMFLQEKKARQRAVAAEQIQNQLREQAQVEKEKAQIEASKSEQVSLFFQDMLKGAGPSVEMGRDTKLLQDILTSAFFRAESTLTNQPEVLVTLLTSIGDAEEQLGEYASAERAFSRALAIDKQLRGEAHHDVAWLMNKLGAAFLAAGNPYEAESLQRQALAMQRKSAGGEKLFIGATLINLADALQQEPGKMPEAESLTREALQIFKKLLGEDHPSTMSALNTLATVVESEGVVAEAQSTRQEKFTEAESLRRECLALGIKLSGTNNPDIAILLGNLANVLTDEGKLAEAEINFRNALSMERQFFAPWHPFVVNLANNLVNCLRRESKNAEAEKVFNEILPPARADLYAYANLLRLRGNYFALCDKWQQAAADFSGIIELQPNSYNDYNSLASVFIQAGDLENYRHFCAECLTHFEPATNLETVGLIALDCMILPTADVAMEKVAKMVELMVSASLNDRNLVSWQFDKGLLEYRLGHFTNAVNWTQSDLAAGTSASPAGPYFVLAMAEQHLGKSAEAKTAFSKGVETLNAALSCDRCAENWQFRVQINALKREAQTCLEASAN